VPTDSEKQCAGGEVCVDYTCRKLCAANADCPSGQVCNATSGLCEAPAQPAPSITSVDGDGLADATSGHTPHGIGSGLVISGANLGGVTVSLVGQSPSLPTFASLDIRPGATADRLEVDLPSGVTPGSYTLHVENQYGATDVTTPFLQGPAGVCDASACVSQTFPGASRVSTVVARSVNGATTTEVSVTLDGRELVTAPANGVWLGVLDRATHALATSSSFNKTYDVGQTGGLQALLLSLMGLTSDQIAIVVTRGSISAVMSQDALGTGNTLAVLLKQLGASDAVRSLGAGEALLVVGVPGLGEGNGSFVLSSSGVAEATALVVDGSIVGPHTASALGRTVSTAEIEDGAVTSSKLALGTITTLTGANMSLPFSLGALTVTAGAVGVGYATPSAALDVNGAVHASGDVSADGSGSFYGVGIGRVGTGWYGDGGNLAARPPAGGDLYVQEPNKTNTYVARFGPAVGGGSINGNLSVSGTLSTGSLNCSGCVTGDDVAIGSISNAKLDLEFETIEANGSEACSTGSPRICFLVNFIAYSGSTSASQQRGCHLYQSESQWCLTPYSMSGGNTECTAMCF
jgi:Cys-rich repeat protein